MEGAALAILICVSCSICKILDTRTKNIKKTLEFYDRVRSFNREHKYHDNVYIDIKDTRKE